MKKALILIFLVTNICFGNDMFWSKTGHRAIGEVAQKHLSKKARKAINRLLKGESLALAANYADEIKADRSFSKFNAWHYVNFPSDKKYTDVKPSKHGDLITGIEKCITIVKDDKSSHEEKVFYLKMLIHLVGDLHQPLHAGRHEDKGGNDIQVQWFGEGSNLHRVWDSNIINSFGMSYTEIANTFTVLSKKEVQKIQKGFIHDWVEESQDIANDIYTSVEVGEKLGYKYSYKYTNILRSQLQKGGLRLAKVLNDIFK